MKLYKFLIYKEKKNNLKLMKNLWLITLLTQTKEKLNPKRKTKKIPKNFCILFFSHLSHFNAIDKAI